jgi:hypothetical protein
LRELAFGGDQFVQRQISCSAQVDFVQPAIAPAVAIPVGASADVFLPGSEVVSAAVKHKPVVVVQPVEPRLRANGNGRACILWLRVEIALLDNWFRRALASSLPHVISRFARTSLHATHSSATDR